MDPNQIQPTHWYSQNKEDGNEEAPSGKPNVTYGNKI